MATMTARPTLPLDQETMRRIQLLASAWKISRTEAMRRVIAQAAPAVPPAPALSQSQIEETLRSIQTYYDETGGIQPDVADAYVQEVYENRKNWRDE